VNSRISLNGSYWLSKDFYGEYWCWRVSPNSPPRMLVLKSGSFGKPDFLERALEDLKKS